MRVPPSSRSWEDHIVVPAPSVTAPPSHAPPAAPAGGRAGSDRRWHFAPGEEIVPGLLAQESLGGGRRFEAWIAFDEHRYILVVAKLLRPGQVADERARAVLAGEADALARVSHPVVARLLDRRSEGPRPLITLELVDGPRLSTLLRRHGRLAVEQVAPLGVQLGAGLHHLHRVGLMHLDVKPKNIIMAGPPRLIDLSVARDVATGPTTGPGIGTRTYMAPEQVDPAAYGGVTPAADVWGLGTVLQEAYAGAPAFPRDGEHKHPQLHQPPAPLPADTPPPLAELVAACLQPTPSARPAPADVVDALDKIVAAMPRRMRLSSLRPR